MGFVGDWRICGFVLPAFFVVMFFRSIATGVGESFYGPCYPPLIAAYHKSTRSIALSIHQGALYFGLMTSGAITAWALDFLGSWRHVFMVFGGAGFLLGLFFVFALRDTPVARPGAAAGGGLLAGVKYFFRTPTAVCAMAGFVAIVFVNNAYLFWAPKYMSEKFGTSVGAAATQTMLWHHLFAFAAIMAGGVLTDRMVRSMPRFRIGFQVVSMLCGAPCLMAIGFLPSAAAMVSMTAAYGVFRGFFEVNTHATLFDVVPERYRSTSVGIFTVFAFLFGGLSGVLMGALSHRYGVRGFEIGFVAMGAAYVVGALFMLFAFFRTFRRDRIDE
jgi:sugar phosphate permease